MKPMIIIPPDTMSAEDIKELRANDICVVVASDPSKVKFVDPIPAVSSRTQIDKSAIKLSRILLSGHWGNWTQNNYVDRSTIAMIWADCLVRGTELAHDYVDPEARYTAIFNEAKADELRRLAREEAKAERAAAKAKAK